jgi:4-hydroxy-4-methyl-2-oxoglutarate aldolase
MGSPGIGAAYSGAVKPDEGKKKALLALGSATLGESGGHPMRARIRQAWPGARLAAPAVPVKCTPGDNLAIHVAVATAPGGSALVVDVGDVTERGYWGEVLTTGAEARGLAGLVIDGGVRDVEQIAAHGFPVFSETVALKGATKQHPGTVGSPTTVGGVTVSLGDWVVGDQDGVTVIPGGSVEEVIEAGRAREQKERDMFEKLRAGSTTVELLGIDPGPIEVADF